MNWPILVETYCYMGRQGIPLFLRIKYAILAGRHYKRGA